MALIFINKYDNLLTRNEQANTASCRFDQNLEGKAITGKRETQS
jgi:hypothetical protein